MQGSPGRKITRCEATLRGVQRKQGGLHFFEAVGPRGLFDDTLSRRRLEMERHFNARGGEPVAKLRKNTTASKEQGRSGRRPGLRRVHDHGRSTELQGCLASVADERVEHHAGVHAKLDSETSGDLVAQPLVESHGFPRFDQANETGQRSLMRGKRR